MVERISISTAEAAMARPTMTALPTFAGHTMACGSGTSRCFVASSSAI